MTRPVVSGTGHRPNSLPCGYDDKHPWAIAIKKRLLETLIRINPSIIWSGMALGFDTWLAEAALLLGIQLGCMCPCRDQASQWKIHDASKYRNILSKAEEVRFTVNGPYRRGCMNKRNSELLNELEGNKQDNKLIALWSGKKNGGTWGTINKAYYRGIEIVNLYPQMEMGEWKPSARLQW